MEVPVNIFEELDKTKAKEISDAVYNSARRYLLAFVYLHEPIVFKDLANHFKMQSNLLSYHLNKLKMAGLIKNEYIAKREANKGYSKYTISETGKKFLELTKAKEFLDKVKDK